tara:strand:+ start:275 stop:1267 length:993 start_codon:yes stop_codon:yes gene_type:complete
VSYFSYVILSIRNFVRVVILFLCFGSLVTVAENSMKRMVQTDSDPKYVRNMNYPDNWFQVLRTGIDAARDYLGNYGPLCVYIIGQEKDELKSDRIANEIIDAYCRNRHGGQGGALNDCLKRKGTYLIKRAREGSTEAYLSYVDFNDSPLSELVFINPHGFPMPYLYTRGIHEYTHVYQRAFPSTPTWLTEGGAEFLAFYIGDKNKWINFEKSMKESMRMAKFVKEGEASLVDFEDINKIENERPHLKKYYRHLAYDAGAWATALLIHSSESRSVKQFAMNFYPMVEKNGWQSAVSKYAGFDGVDQFYDKFNSLLKRTAVEQELLLRSIKP